MAVSELHKKEWHTPKNKLPYDRLIWWVWGEDWGHVLMALVIGEKYRKLITQML